MIDTIRIEYSYPTKTIIGTGSASAIGCYLLAGYSLETILWYEKNFQKDIEKVINHIIKSDDIFHRPSLKIYTSESKYYKEKEVFYISKNGSDLYIYDFSKPNTDRQYLTKAEIKNILVDFYRETMLTANQQTA